VQDALKSLQGNKTRTAAALNTSCTNKTPKITKSQNG